MRWQGLVNGEVSAEPTLFEATPRTFDTPEFADTTFYEVRAKSILNKVPAQSRMPFRWTINPYRGCGHKCRYCFARPTHQYLGFDIGADFDSKIVVKVNAVELLRAALRRRSWRGEHIAMGTNVDPYQRAEGRYRLMPGIIETLATYRNPFSILTKGTLVLRDIPTLRSAADSTEVDVAVSLGSVDDAAWRVFEAGAPNPTARLKVVKALADAGIGGNVLMAPILPYLTDSDEQLSETLRALSAAGATRVTPIVLHLRPGVREWFLPWLEQHHPHLMPRYEQLYRRAYATGDYVSDVTSRVKAMAHRLGLNRKPAILRGPDPVAEQLSLM